MLLLDMNKYLFVLKDGKYGVFFFSPLYLSRLLLALSTFVSCLGVGVVVFLESDISYFIQCKASELQSC